MKKYLSPIHLPYLVITAGILGLLLRIWTFGSGPDERGLFLPHPVAWALLWILTALTLFTVGRLSSGLKVEGTYEENFPASISSAIGCGLAALGIGITAFPSVMSPAGLLATLVGITGILATGSMLLVAYCRLKGRRPFFLCHVLVCVFLGLEVFDRCRGWSNESQLGVILFPFLTLLSLMLAAYQLAAFDADIGKRRSCLFWSLTSTYLCIVSLADKTDLVLFCCMTVWLMTNLCALHPLKRHNAPPEPVPAEGPDTSPVVLPDWLKDA